MVMPLMMSMYATNLGYDSAAGMFGTNQAHTALSNGVGGYESQNEVASIAAQDKAIMFAGISARSNYLASTAMQADADNLRKKNQEQKERMLANGTLFF